MPQKRKPIPHRSDKPHPDAPASDLALREQAYANLMAKLVAGDLPANSVVSEQSLAQEMGMSRTPVREAIRRLVHEGVMEQLPRYGTRVRDVARRDLVELYELREALEPFAAAKAAGSLSAAERERLEGLVAEVRRVADEMAAHEEPVLSGPLLNRFLSADLGFHLLVLQAADNARLLDIVSQTRLLTRVFAARRQAHDREVLEETHRYHHAVLNAILSGDKATASQVMLNHLQTSKRRALENFDHRTATLPGAMLRGMSPDLAADFQRIESERSSSPNGSNGDSASSHGPRPAASKTIKAKARRR